jgi:hypothetical protein
MRRQLAFFLILVISLLGVAAIAQQGPSPIGQAPATAPAALFIERLSLAGYNVYTYGLD